MKQYACFSQKLKDQVGSVIWQSVNGKEIEVTSVHYDYECSLVLWDDKILLGEVIKYIRGIQDHS